MKFLCVECDEQMAFEERAQPGDGTFAAVFRCARCQRSVAMLANPMETQLVSSLGVRIGGRELDPPPLELVRTTMVGRDDAFVDAPPRHDRVVARGAGPPGAGAQFRARHGQADLH